MTYRRLFAATNRGNLSAEFFTYRVFGWRGMANISMDYSRDLSCANVYGEIFFQPVRPLGVSTGWSQQEIRTAMMAGVALETEKAASQRCTIREQEHKRAFYGDGVTGTNGFLANSNIPRPRQRPTVPGGLRPGSARQPLRSYPKFV